jgi:methionyl-tRNA formyltransferase
MLVEALRRGLHVPPYQPVRENENDDSGKEGEAGCGLRHAPKITTADRQICWTEAGAGKVALQARVLGPLWSHLETEDGVEKRVILEDVEEVAVAGRSGEGEGEGGARYVTWLQKSDGSGSAEVATLRYVVDGSGNGEAVLMRMVDGSWLRVGRIKVEGCTSKPARSVLESMRPR